MTVLRKGRSTDAGKVGAILSEFASTTSWMPQLHTGAEDVAHAGRLIDKGWVTIAQTPNAQGPDSVVGFAACDGTEVDALYVTKAARGKGVGTALLGALQQRHEKLTLWTFQANKRAQKFYERHGFKEIARSDGARNDEKLPDVQFEWIEERG